MYIFGYVVASVALVTVVQCKALGNDKLFVAGELTPVWLAEEDSDTNMHYEKLESGIVKKAIESYQNENNKTLDNNNVYAADPNEEYVYPSVLVMMEYKDRNYPADNNPEAQKKFIYDNILYALAYWNEVNNQLKVVKNPSVQIRVAGIVIAKNQFAYSKQQHRYITWEPFVPNGFFLKIYNSLNMQLFNWDRATNNFFKSNNFNVVATMTNLDPAGLFERSWSFQYDNCQGNIRHLPHNSGLMFYDNDYGLDRAVGEMAHLLGRQYVGDASLVKGEDLTSDDLNAIRRNLASMSCWKEPNESWPPGKPVPTILRKDLP